MFNNKKIITASTINSIKSTFKRVIPILSGFISIYHYN